MLKKIHILLKRGVDYIIKTFILRKLNLYIIMYFSFLYYNKTNNVPYSKGACYFIITF